MNINLKRPNAEQVEIEVVTEEAGAKNITIYYINTSEIPSELSRENFISSHVR